MAHHIEAAIVPADIDRTAAAEWFPRVLNLPCGLCLLPLNDELADAMSEAAGDFSRESDQIICDVRAVHGVLRSLTEGRRYALIKTDYFGGVGDQAACVYEGDRVLMPARTERFGPINEALLMLGVEPRGGRDPFDVVGLGQYRWFD